MSDMNSYSLEICGIRRNVSNFEYIKQCVPNLTVDKYLSMLFTNLGYNKRPKDLQWLIDGRTVGYRYHCSCRCLDKSVR